MGAITRLGQPFHRNTHTSGYHLTVDLVGHTIAFIGVPGSGAPYVLIGGS